MDAFEGSPKHSGVYLGMGPRSAEKRPSSLCSRVLALYELTKCGRYESDFWELLEKHYDPALESLLQERVITGSENDDARVSASRAALRHAPLLIEGAFSASSDLKPQRLLELALDVQTCLDDEKREGEVSDLDFSKLTSELEQNKKRRHFSIARRQRCRHFGTMP